MVTSKLYKQWSGCLIAALALPCGFTPLAVVAQSTTTNSGPADIITGNNASEVKQLFSKQAEQAELIQKLLGRLEQLEKDKAAEVQRSGLAERAHQAEVRKLREQIKALEGKLDGLESGRVVPGVSASSEGGPTPTELEQKNRATGRDDELATGAAESEAKESPKLAIGSGGLVFSSPDTNFVFKLHALLQVDTRTYFDDSSDSQATDGFLIRRARPIFEGTVFRDFEYLLVPDFAGASATLLDAWLTYQYQPELEFRIGKMKEPVGLEYLQSDAFGLFNERSLATDLVPGRNLGFQLGGDIANAGASYALGIYNETGDYRNSGNSAFDDGVEFAGRIFLQPFKQSSLGGLRGIGLGVGGSFADLSFNANGLPNTTGGTLPGYATTGQQQFFAYNPATGAVLANGTHWRLSPQAYYYWGPFGWLGEYAISDQGVYNTVTLARANLRNAAWQVNAQWVLTGESASFAAFTPKHSFDPRIGNWGAWQLVGRVSQLRIDDDAFPVFSNPATSAGEAFSWSVGLNWWLNKNIRVLTSFSHTTFEGGGTGSPATQVPPGTVTSQDEKVFFTRVQLSF